MSETPSASEKAAEAKDLAEDAAETVEHVRPDDDELAGADVEQNDPGERTDVERADGEEGEELTDPGAPMA
ncbi:hypothetical protein [Georgenia deserti]|uniref:Uncharacterized protein n=1 Tax=Georgenia deserti TaxID=2093781 RepID=A0ABW4L8V9_9MICO